MTYHSYTKGELERLGIEDGELAIYTGMLNPRHFETLTPGAHKRNVYVYLWRDGKPQEQDACFQQDRAGLDVLEIQDGGYAFLRDKPSGYIRQMSGPAKPITVANLGAFPLRVDTFLGKFTVRAGSILRLSESVYKREKKKVLLTITSEHNNPVKSAELWDGFSWYRLNIRKESSISCESNCLAVLDDNAIVQYMEVNRKREILMMDSPEPNPDYEIYISVQSGDWVTLRFDRNDYRDGRVVQRKRTISRNRWDKPVVYDLQKLRETQTQNAVDQCIAELPSISIPANKEEPCPRRQELFNSKLKEFLSCEDGPEGTISISDKMDAEIQQDAHPSKSAVDLAPLWQNEQKTPFPVSPEGFPE